MGSQEISKPVMIGIVAVFVVLIGLLGWNYLKPQKYPGYQAPTGPQGMTGQAAPRMIPGMEPGRMAQPPGPPR